MKSEPGDLARRFKLIAFDWDGTAVVDRRDEAEPLVGPIGRLLRAGVFVVVVTGTNFGNVDRQFCSLLNGPHKSRLFVLANRGSEVFGWGERNEPILKFRRRATEREDALLTLVADAVREDLERRTGLEIRVVYDRLNRRKIDLIPVARFSDPPKSAIGELLSAVETRLEAAGLRGIGEALALAQETSRERGFPEARITSDVKHIEVGLTDKADSIAWVFRELVVPAGIGAEDVVIAGDEFGMIAGLAGSDSLMMIPEARGATFCSVGLEPAGVPEGVLHLGGGPARFRQILGLQASLHPVVTMGRLSEPEWTLVDEGVRLEREREFESLFAISNGFLGTRGSVAEGTSSSAAETFVGGVFEPEPGDVPTMARIFDWTWVSSRVGDSPMRIGEGESLEHRRTLDLQQAFLGRFWRFRDEAGRVTHFTGFRFASLSDRGLLAQSVTFTPENYSGTIEVEARFTVAFAHRTDSGVEIAAVPSVHVETPEGSMVAVRPVEGSAERERIVLRVEIGKTYRIDRVVAVHTSLADAVPLRAAHEHAARAKAEGIMRVFDAHRHAWRERWGACDVIIEGDARAQKALRFALYHLIGAANPENERYSIGARALTGHAYRGHVFWDTEIYMVPFFTLTYPDAARALLLYRYHTLPAARAKAARAGYRGAMYAWESADTGEDVTPSFVVAPDGEVIPIRVGAEEQHITADVAYAVWRYWEATGDESFLLGAGAEILFESARFWETRAVPGADGLLHILHVIGPDEYHESVDDNAFTNGMARHNLEVAADAARLLTERWPERYAELSRQLRLSEDEPARWREVAAGMYTGFDPATGLFEQFRGYFDLEEMSVPPFEERTAPADVLYGRARVQRSKLVKQPDVVMLLYLLWDRFSPNVRETNFRYYEARTSHGSSLSPPVHAAFAARLGDLDRAEHYFQQTMDIDLSDNMGNAAGGVHAAALGGLWQAVVFGFAGLDISGTTPTASPALPSSWRRLAFNIQWRGQTRAFDLSPEAGRRARRPEVQA